MNRIVVLGEGSRVRGFRLAGADVTEAQRPADVEAAWDALPPDTTLLILTIAAEEVLRGRLAERPRLLWAVMP